LPAGASWERTEPTGRTDTIEGGLRLPLGQAAITGGVALILAALVALWQGWPWTLPPVAGVVVFCLAWWLLLLQSRQLLASRETVTADPTEAPFSVEVEITDTTEGKKRMTFAQFTGKREHVRKFARSAVDGTPTPEGAGLSRRKFNVVRDEALRRRLVVWRDPSCHTQGLLTTSMGKVAFRRLLDGLLD